MRVTLAAPGPARLTQAASCPRRAVPAAPRVLRAAGAPTPARRRAPAPASAGDPTGLASSLSAAPPEAVGALVAGVCEGRNV
jgi:hypothetical protein